MPEWKIHNLENDRKFTPWKMTENLHMYSQQNVRIITPCKMLEKAQVENTLPGSCTTWKMMEWEMHTMENNRK